MKINDVSIDPSAWPTPQLAAVHELLRQRARELGYIEDGASDSDVERAIERTLAEEVAVPEPTDEECRRWYEANRQRFRSGDLVCARHILFQITPGTPVPAVCSVAETMLHELQAQPKCCVNVLQPSFPSAAKRVHAPIRARVGRQRRDRRIGFQCCSIAITSSKSSQGIHGCTRSSRAHQKNNQ